MGPFQWIVGIISNYSVDKRYNRFALLIIPSKCNYCLNDFGFNSIMTSEFILIF